MILVRISTTDERFVIELKHKIDYMVEKKFRRIKSLKNRTIYVFVHLFLSAAKLILKEIFMRFH